MQCEAKASTPGRPNYGKQCQRRAVHGTTRCERHGGQRAANSPLPGAATLPERLQCGRTRRNGEQCKNYAMRGTTVCRKHGGTAPQTQKRARERLMEMVDPAIIQLHRILEKDTTTDADKLRAITMVLDRTGYGREAKLEVEVKPYEKLMEGIIIRRPEVESAAGAESEDPNIIDAEVVEDAEPTQPEPRVVDQRLDSDEPSAPFRPYIVGSANPRRR